MEHATAPEAGVCRLEACRAADRRDERVDIVEIDHGRDGLEFLVALPKSSDRFIGRAGGAIAEGVAVDAAVDQTRDP